MNGWQGTRLNSAKLNSAKTQLGRLNSWQLCRWGLCAPGKQAGRQPDRHHSPTGMFRRLFGVASFLEGLMHGLCCALSSVVGSPSGLSPLRVPLFLLLLRSFRSHGPGLIIGPYVRPRALRSLRWGHLGLAWVLFSRPSGASATSCIIGDLAPSGLAGLATPPLLCGQG